MTKKQVMRMVEKEKADKVKKIDALWKKVNACPFGDNLQWNRIEIGAFLEYTIDFLDILLFILKLDGITLDDVKRRIQSLIQRVERDLLGDELSGEEGPWNNRSTSPGANRLAIAKCDADRKSRITAIKVLKALGD